MKKFTLCLTQRCNLRCSYCYIDKRDAVMQLPVAEKIIDFMFAHSEEDEVVDIGFFGGEPLLEFDLVQKITHRIMEHALYAQRRVTLSIVTNGTLFTREIAEFLIKHKIVLCMSCDGSPQVQDRFRRYADGRGSSEAVLRTIVMATELLPLVLVNAVYRPETLEELSETVDFLSRLGLRQIYLNPDVSAAWKQQDADKLPEVYGRIGRQFADYYRKNDPHFISLIDSKIAVILRRGYQKEERCQMGSREMAFSPEGNVYPCERLVGQGTGGRHCIGNIEKGLPDLPRVCFATDPGQEAESECSACGVREYCMNWCGCSNYLSTGKYNRVSPFLCASEKASIGAAFNAFRALQEEFGGVFAEHLAGMPSMSSRIGRIKEVI
jgi:uncharacterized protein